MPDDLRAESRSDVVRFRLKLLFRGLVAALLCLATAAPASADYSRGMNLWDRGKLTEAVAEFRRAAEAGDARAQDQLGILYEEGQGVTEDAVSAAFWYEKAALQGFAPAQMNLARLYRNGKGLAQDESKAVHWYTKAAESGLAVAQFFLGLMYDTGKGVPHDPMRAYMWFSLAAAQGDRDAQLKRDRLGKRLNETQLAEALRLGARYGDLTASGETVSASANSRPAPATYEKPEGIPSAPTPLSAKPSKSQSEQLLGQAELRELQRRLRKLGFSPGPADGRPGPRTRAAVRALERKRGVAETGALSQASLELARAPVPSPAVRTEMPGPAATMPPRPATLPSRGPELVREIQRQLAWLGFDPGPVDGVIGKRTVQAARDYGRATGQRVSGKLTPRLLRSLLRTAESRARTVTKDQSRAAALAVAPARRAPGQSAATKKLPVAPSVPTKPLASPAGVVEKPVSVERSENLSPTPAEPVKVRPNPYKLRGKALVREFQRELQRLGYHIGAVDGVIGRQTVKAVKAFQRTAGLRRTGRLTPSLLKRMQLTAAPRAAAKTSVALETPLSAKVERTTDSRAVRSAPVSSSVAGEEVPSRESEGQLRSGGSELVLAIQRRLNRLGYPVGTPDGIVGSRTVTSARKFQRSIGRRATGTLGTTLLRQLDAAVSSGALSRDKVRELQKLLNRLGYQVGPADGVAGRKTRQAVREFQRRSGLSQDGRLTLKLLDALRIASNG